jgi:hypothetical protein
VLCRLSLSGEQRLWLLGIQRRHWRLNLGTAETHSIAVLDQGHSVWAVAYPGQNCVLPGLKGHMDSTWYCQLPKTGKEALTMYCSVSKVYDQHYMQYRHLQVLLRQHTMSAAS